MSHLQGRPADEEDPNDGELTYRENNGSGLVNTRISNRENDYQSKRLRRGLSPSRGGDAFEGETPVRGYKDIMMSQELHKEELAVRKQILEKAEKDKEGGGDKDKKKRRWDEDEGNIISSTSSQWDNLDAVGKTPVYSKAGASSDETPIISLISTGPLLVLLYIMPLPPSVRVASRSLHRACRRSPGSSRRTTSSTPGRA